MFVTVELLCGTREEGRERRMIVNNIEIHNIYGERI
jgi:hypothetical protein